MNLKRIIATAIVWTGYVALAAFVGLALVVFAYAFLAGWPQSLYVLLAAPVLVGLCGLLILLFAWALDTYRKP